MSMSQNAQLALFGEAPVRERDFPVWPRADKQTEQNLLKVLYSGRWAISGPYAGTLSFECQFSEEFAAFHNIKYCIPTANGSSALTIALEALDVRFGDEVLVPGLTWVACASSVTGIGAIPILVDVEPDTLCMSVEDARTAISPRTRAILLVHQFCSIADLAGFTQLSKELGIPLIEDCSQAHGAQWHRKRVGTFGDIGAFSTQHTKVLTSGEGGAAITDSSKLYDRMQQLRADGRRYVASPPARGTMELEEIGSIQGRNYCLSEFHAAILVDRLKHLDRENEIREHNARYLNQLLVDVGGIEPLQRRPGADHLTYWRYCVRLQRDRFEQCDIDILARALTAELSVVVLPIDTPLDRHILYNPLNSPRTTTDNTIRKQRDPCRFQLPRAEEARANCLTLPHWTLLGSKEDLESIARAFSKVKLHAHELCKKEA